MFKCGAAEQAYLREVWRTQAWFTALAFNALGESMRVALYMPGITLIPQEGLPADDSDQQLSHLRAAIVEIDTQLGTLTGSN